MYLYYIHFLQLKYDPNWRPRGISRGNPFGPHQFPISLPD